MSSKTVGSGTAGNNTGGATADYTSLDSWESAETGGDAAATIITKVAAVQTTTFTASASGHTFLVTADGSTFVNAPMYAAATSRARIECDTLVVLVISGDGWTIEKTALREWDGNRDSVQCSANATIRRTMIFGNRIGAYQAGTSKILTLSNVGVVCYGVQFCIGSFANSGAEVDAYHVSAFSASASAAYYRESGTVINTSGCIAQGSYGDACWEDTAHSGGDYNVSQDTSAPGSNSLKSKSGVFTDTTAGSEDLSLSGSIAVNIVDRSGFPSDTDTDLVGTTRPSTGADAGVWQTPSAPPPSRSGRSMMMAAGC